jgi:hypothetical protein
MVRNHDPWFDSKLISHGATATDAARDNET